MSKQLAELNARFAVSRAGQYEKITRALYDHQNYPAAGGIPSLTFFGTPYTAAGRTLADTNMESGGTLPNPQSFLIESIAVTIDPGVDVGAQHYANDVNTLANLGVLVLRIGSKDYVTEGPLNRFPPDTRLAVTLGAQANGEFAVVTGRTYKILPFLLKPTENFNVQVLFPNAPALPSNTAARIGVFLNGTLYRLSQ